MTLLFPALIIEFVAIALLEGKDKFTRERLPSGKSLLIGLTIFLISYGMSFLGDVGDYLWVVGLIAIFLPWELISEKTRSSFRKKDPNAKGLTTAQLSILWVGSVVTVGLCIAWMLVARSFGPAVLAVLILTGALVLSRRLYRKQMGSRCNSRLAGVRDRTTSSGFYCL